MEDDFQTPRSFALMAAVFEGSLVVVALGLGWLLGCPPTETLRWTLAHAGLGAVATLPLLMVLWVCVRWPVRWPLSPLVKLLRVVDEVLVPLFRPCGLLELAGISLLAGLGEEMLFRGVLQEAVSDWAGGAWGPAWGTWVGLAAVSVLFGLVHCVTRTYAVLAGLIGLYLGWLWVATGNLLVPITAHAVYDFLALVYFVRTRGKRDRWRDHSPV